MQLHSQSYVYASQTTNKKVFFLMKDFKSVRLFKTGERKFLKKCSSQNIKCIMHMYIQGQTFYSYQYVITHRLHYCSKIWGQNVFFYSVIGRN